MNYAEARKRLLMKLNEGHRKLSRADKLRFLNIAQGSLEECRYYIILSYDIGYINKETNDNLEFLINGTSWKLNGYAEAITQNKAMSD